MSSMTITAVLQGVTLAGIVAIGLLLRRFLPSYLSEKGKNLATKEDVGEITARIEEVKARYALEVEIAKNLATKEDVADITSRIEEVKAKYAHELEGLRAAIHSRVSIHQFRYEREFEMLLPLSERLVELRDSALSLRPETEYVDDNEPEDARKQRKLARYGAAARELYHFSEVRRPFLPESLVQLLRDLDQLAWKEVVQYRHRSPRDEVHDSRYWDNALENAAKIQVATEAVLGAIRERVLLWERFEPGP